MTMWCQVRDEITARYAAVMLAMNKLWEVEIEFLKLQTC